MKQDGGAYQLLHQSGISRGCVQRNASLTRVDIRLRGGGGDCIAKTDGTPIYKRFKNFRTSRFRACFHLVITSRARHKSHISDVCMYTVYI